MALKELNSTGIIPKIKRLQFLTLVHNPAIMVLDIKTEKEEVP
jgi:hypothetical protein